MNLATKNHSIEPKLLVIDDDPTYCQLMLKMGKQQGFKVITYSSPRLAYQDLAQLEFDLAVIDFDLGIVTGAQMSHFMEGIHCDKPIILVSGSDISQSIPSSKWVKETCLKKDGTLKIFSTIRKTLNQSSTAQLNP